MKKYQYWLIASLCSLVMPVWAEIPAPLQRWHVPIEPFQWTLQGEIVRSINSYRDTLGATGLDVGEARILTAETERIQQILRSRGYYSAEVTPYLSGNNERMSYRITLGTRSTLSSIGVVGDVQPQQSNWQMLEQGDPLNAVSVLAQQARLLQFIRRENCFYNVSVDHRVVLNENSTAGALTFVVRASNPTQFASIQFEGGENISDEFLARTADIRAGDCFQSERVDQSVISLFDTGLFSRVRPNVTLTESGVDVSYQLTERKPRSISVSAGWRSEQGFGATLGWQHRNILGAGQGFGFDIALQQQRQLVGVTTTIPSFFTYRNKFRWRNEVERQTADIEALRFSSTATLQRQASRVDYFEYGIGYSILEEQVDSNYDRFQQFRLNAAYRYDNVTNPFTPSEGLRYSLSLTPIFDIDADYAAYMLSETSLQNFLTLGEPLLLANRLRWDSYWTEGLFGQSFENIPKSELLTAGGSNSIRGFGFQSIGENTSEFGGKNRWVSNNELRLTINPSWQVVGFLDAAAITENPIPANDEPWFYGYGFGVRYLTRFAPIRFDIGFPGNPREADNPLFLYVSLGQSF